MEIRIEKRRFYKDKERYEWCRKCKLSKIPFANFKKSNNLIRTNKEYIISFKESKKIYLYFEKKSKKLK